MVGPDDAQGARLLGEVVLGIGLGVVVPWVAIRLEQSRFFSAATSYEPLNAFAIGLVLLGLATITHANEFLAAFAGGVTVASTSSEVRDAFNRFGELVTELLKLAALLVFGALISPSFLGEIPLRGYAFALAALLLVRPVAIGLSLIGSSLRAPERLVAGWFGPKGFASVVYGLLILKGGFPLDEELFHLIALVVFASVVAHSSTDVLVARWLGGKRDEAEPPSPALVPEPDQVTIR